MHSVAQPGLKVLAVACQLERGVWPQFRRLLAVETLGTLADFPQSAPTRDASSNRKNMQPLLFDAYAMNQMIMILVGKRSKILARVIPSQVHVQ